MPPVVALSACVAVIVILLRLERTRNPTASAALWIPTLWMLVAGSRPVGRWLGAEGQTAADGSPLDRLYLIVLLSLALRVCIKRRIEWSRILRDNLWVILFFLYLGTSILWVDYPFVSLKRWIRSSGPIVMALVVLSEKQPLEALGSILRRCAYVLVPLSVVLIRYYPHMGRDYHRWTGVEMWTGVATHKNSLGQLCAVSAFFLVWSLLRGERATEVSKTRHHTYADMFVVGIAAYLLMGPTTGSFSATSITILAVGIAMVLMFGHLRTFARFVSGNVTAYVISLALLYLLLAGPVTAAVSDIFGRDENLTGRATEIWPLVLEAAARHPILGAGYGGAWGVGGDLSEKIGVEQAHNGYLDIYLELGIVGLMFLSVFFLNFSSRVRRAFTYDRDWGLFALCFLQMTLIYNLSETAFFDVYLATTMVVLNVVLSAAVVQPAPTRGLIDNRDRMPQPPVVRSSSARYPRRSSPVHVGRPAIQRR
jgi:O-antigen ligase